MYALPPILLGVAALAFFAFQIVRFLGIGLLGLLIGFIAVQVDLDKEGVIGPSVLHAQQMMARQNANPSERAAHRSEMRSFARPLLIAKIISAALVILGLHEPLVSWACCRQPGSFGRGVHLPAPDLYLRSDYRLPIHAAAAAAGGHSPHLPRQHSISVQAVWR